MSRYVHCPRTVGLAAPTDTVSLKVVFAEAPPLGGGGSAASRPLAVGPAKVDDGNEWE